MEVVAEVRELAECSSAGATPASARQPDCPILATGEFIDATVSRISIDELGIAWAAAQEFLDDVDIDYTLNGTTAAVH